MKKVFVLMALCTIVSCKSSEECPVVGETKCESNQIWLCNKSGNWDKIDDCAELSALNGMDLVCWPPTPDYPAACLPPDIPVDDAGIPDEDAFTNDDAGVSDDADAQEDSAFIQDVVNIQDVNIVDVVEDQVTEDTND
jgi:hypothetical protein